MKTMKIRFFHHSIISILVFFQYVFAQPVPVSVRSAVEAALEHHASVRIAEQRVRTAEANLDEAGARLLPKVQLTGRAFALSNVEQGTITVPFLPGSPSIPLFESIPHSFAARVQVAQPVFNGFRLVNAKEAAAFGAEAARADQTWDASSLALNTEKAYWGWVQAREAQQVLQDMVEQMKLHEGRVRHLMDKGMARESDVLNIRVRRADVEVRAIEARTRASIAMMRLNSLIGKPLGTELAPEDDAAALSFAPLSATVDELAERAVGTRPDLASARFRTDMAKAAVSVAEAGWYPSIALAAAYDYSNPNQRIIPPKDKFDGTWEVGLTFQWTVWDWMTTSSQTAQAEAQQRQAEEGYRLMLDGARLEVALLWRSVQDSKERLESARLSRDAAEESFRITEQEYDKGMATTVDVTDARVDVLRAKLSFSQAAAEAAIARAELRHATGETP